MQHVWIMMNMYDWDTYMIYIHLNVYEWNTCKCKIYLKHWTKKNKIKINLHFSLENKYSNDQSHGLVKNSNK